MNYTKNITLNSQIDYWNGQKKSTSWQMGPFVESGDVCL